MRDDHPLDRQLRDPLEGFEQRLAVGLVHEYAHDPIRPCKHVAADERRVFLDQEDDLLRLPVKLHASTPRATRRVTGFGIFRHSAFGGPQTDAPYRSTTLAAPR